MSHFTQYSSSTYTPPHSPQELSPTAPSFHWSMLSLSVPRAPSPASSVDSPTTPSSSGASRKVVNTFMRYKNDFLLRYPEICALEKAPSQRMRIAARMWEAESMEVRDEYERKYCADMLASGVKGGEADYNRRKARSQSVTAARRAKRESEGAVLSPRSEYIVSMWSRGLRGDPLIRVVENWDQANAQPAAPKRKKGAVKTEPSTPSPPMTPPSTHSLPAVSVYSPHANTLFTQHQLPPIPGNPMQLPTSHAGYRLPPALPTLPTPQSQYDIAGPTFPPSTDPFFGHHAKPDGTSYHFDTNQWGMSPVGGQFDLPMSTPMSPFDLPMLAMSNTFGSPMFSSVGSPAALSDNLDDVDAPFGNWA